ncbi:Tripeptidyl-peptidase SED2 [Trametes pubescens]|uniref:tripeptidyl-peptidase II n=1 Tax=Trametes pubescens TaxID=154538 RepID=A0A1M2W1M9_TRAPU|nr:Tripeptidyl-peptidase SED2 [Trametes pubescens]
MLVASRLLAFVSFGIAAASPLATTTFRVHELRSAVPSGYTEIGPASPQTTLSLRLALAQSDPEGVADALYRVSNPDSDSYGQYLSREEVESFVAPTSDTVIAVNSWLAENNLTATSISSAGDWLSVDVPVAKANGLFNTNFTLFKHTATGGETVRTLEYSLPGSLQGHVDLVHPTISFPVPITRFAPAPGSKRRRSAAFASPKLVSRDIDSACANGTVPACVQVLYDIPLTPAVHKDPRLGVTGFFGNSAHYAWLETFLETFRPDMDPATNFSVVGIDGGSNDQNVPSVSEGELDIQYTVGLATDVPVTYYFIGIDNQDGDLDGFLDEANVLLALDQPPQVLSTSYGFAESNLPFSLVDRLCQAYAQLGARGTTLLFGAGDGGADCAADGSDRFGPTFPSDCPFVTSVGGTQSFSPEEAWIGSSGGFSNYYSRPAYQDAAVSAYLAAHGQENAARWNASGRGFPDVAAKADDVIIYESVFFHGAGTSASTPIIASIVALLNDRLASVGRPPLGFLNPWLYKEGYKAFTDITTGNSSVQCPGDVPLHQINATEGWDPSAAGDPKARRSLAGGGTAPSEVQVLTFSLSPSSTRLAESLFNLSLLIEVYADDTFAFSLETLPSVSNELLRGLAEHTRPTDAVLSFTLSHTRRSPSLSLKASPTPSAASVLPPPTFTPEAVSAAWLSSLRLSLASCLTVDVLPRIAKLTPAGAAQLASDLRYLSNTVMALNVESPELEKWREWVDVDMRRARRNSKRRKRALHWARKRTQ